jgi:tRNA1Val (adenine37-N6)-methyltransferase
MKNNIFNFKDFKVCQSQSSMKIGTDAVLLGAWTRIPEMAQSILDVGAGTGILALQMAQRSFAEIIDAVEIDPRAFEECVDNFENSPWGDRLYCYHSDFHNFAEEIDETYDLIISNPPFFEVSENLSTKERSTARSQTDLNFETLLLGVNQLLHPEGTLSVIVPYTSSEGFIKMAAKVDLYPNQLLNVRGHASSPLKRSLITFKRSKEETSEQCELIIELERHVYTKDYIDLVKDFYLKM